MTDQIASITLRADVSDLKTANNELDKLGQAAAGAADKADDLNSVFRAGAESVKQGSESIKEQQTALKGLLENIDPVNKALNRLDEQQAALRNFQTKGFLDGDDFQHYNKILDDTRLKLTDTGEAAARAQAQIAATQAAEKQSSALKNLLGSIDPTIRAFNSLDEQHAQLVAHFEAGRINGAQFEHFNDVLNQTRQRLSSVADVLPEALTKQQIAAQKAGLSIGQYNQALRMLPMQLTDVATQLAGGQSPFLILLQQGGQIKDSFGGVGNTLKILLTYLNPITAALGLSALAFSGLAVAVYKARREIGEANLAVKDILGMSGEYASKLALNIRAIANASGDSIKNVTSLFVTTKDGADEAVQKMLSVGISYQDAKTKIAEYKDSSDFTSINASIEAHRRQVLGIPDAWSKAAEEARNYYTGADKGRQSVALGGAIDPIVAIIEQAKTLREGLTKATIEGNLAVKNSVDWINKEYLAADSVANAEDRLKKAREQSRKIAFSGDKEAIANAQQLIVLRQREVEEAKKQRDKKDAPKASPVKVTAGDRTLDTYNAETLALQAQLKVLQQHAGVNDVISQQRKQLWEQQAKFSVLEDASQTRALTKDEQSLLATKDKALAQAAINASLGDQIASQERLNKLQDTSQKYVSQMTEKTAALRDGAGLSDRQAQRLREEAQLRQGWLNGGGDLEGAGYQKELAALRNYYAEEDKLRGDWKAGALNGWNEYLDAATNTYSAVSSVAGSALTGLSDMLTNLMTTGKASIKEFGMSMLKMIAEVVNRLLVAYAVQQALGWISGSAGGGSTPSGAYTSAAANVGFDSGGYTGYGSKFEPAGIVHKDEFVFTKEATNRIGVDNLYRLMNGGALGRYASGGLVGGGSGGGSQAGTPGINVDIYVDNKGNATANTSGDGDAAARALADRMKQYVTEGILRAIRDDGAIGGSFAKK